MKTKSQVEKLKKVGGEITTKSFAVGGGEWTIEVYDLDGEFLFELLGSNGTRDEEADDLWGELSCLIHEALRS